MTPAAFSDILAASGSAWQGFAWTRRRDYLGGPSWRAMVPGFALTLFVYEPKSGAPEWSILISLCESDYVDHRFAVAGEGQRGPTPEAVLDRALADLRTLARSMVALANVATCYRGDAAEGVE